MHTPKTFSQPLVVRCFVEPCGDQWQSFCIDLNLAAQGDTMVDAIIKLYPMVDSYFKLAEDQGDLKMLKRVAPLIIFFRYWLARVGANRRALDFPLITNV